MQMRRWDSAMKLAKRGNAAIEEVFVVTGNGKGKHVRTKFFAFFIGVLAVAMYRGLKRPLLQRAPDDEFNPFAAKTGGGQPRSLYGVDNDTQYSVAGGATAGLAGGQVVNPWDQWTDNVIEPEDEAASSDVESEEEEPACAVM